MRSRLLPARRCCAAVLLPVPARAQQVYVGSANGWEAMNAHPEQWEFVRHHADGFYVNFIQMLKPDAKKCAQTSALFTRKNAYYESDSRSSGPGRVPRRRAVQPGLAGAADAGAAWTAASRSPTRA